MVRRVRTCDMGGDERPQRACRRRSYLRTNQRIFCPFGQTAHALNKPSIKPFYRDKFPAESECLTFLFYFALQIFFVILSLLFEKRTKLEFRKGRIVPVRVSDTAPQEYFQISKSPCSKRFWSLKDGVAKLFLLCQK